MPSKPRKPRETEGRDCWIKAGVRPDELALIELLAAQSNRTVSTYIREVSLGQKVAPESLSAYLRHGLNRAVALAKSGATLEEVVARLQRLIGEIDEKLDAAS